MKGEGERHKGRSRGCDAMRVDKYERSRNSVVLVSAHFSICAGFLFNQDLYYNIGVNSFKKTIPIVLVPVFPNKSTHIVLKDVGSLFSSSCGGGKRPTNVHL